MDAYIIAIDQSTSASKVFLLDRFGNIVRRFSKAHEQFYPQPMYVEHNAVEIWQNVKEGILSITTGISPRSIVALSISNQRETTVLWDRVTGEPCCRAIVWQDIRSEPLCKELSSHAHTIQRKTGLQLSPYYPAAKASYLLQSQPELAQKASEGKLCIGTMESYLIYRLTGGVSFCTDVTNASRTQLMNLDSLSWDPFLCRLFRIPINCLAQIIPSDGDFGYVNCSNLPCGIPITGVMGDSHASLFGQGCHHKGMAKATLGTGSSVMMNIGKAPIYSSNGLSTSVGFGFRGQTCYVLEGNVTCCADTLCWLRDEAKIIENVGDVETIATSVPTSGGVYFVPAFSGLGAPYFDGDAKALICGMNRGTTHTHIIRAALESIAYQDADILRAMAFDVNETPTLLAADGGPTSNALLMQFLADLLNCPVQCNAVSEASALGAGYMAGMTVHVYEQEDEIFARTLQGKRYEPNISQDAREALIVGWLDAVKRSR